MALTVALALAAVPALAFDAGSRHPSGSTSSGGHSSSGSSGSGSYSSPSSSSSSSSHDSSSVSSHSSSSRSEHRGSGRSDHRQSSRGHRSDGERHGRVRIYGGYSSYWGLYPYYDQYDGYYDPYYGAYYGWRAPHRGYRYAYDDNYGSLRLMVEPDDTEVYVDGYYAGVVDSFDGIFQRLTLRPGRHEIALKRAEYRTHRIRVYVPVGGSLRIRHQMERGTSLEPSETVIGSPEADETRDRARAEAQGEETQAPERPEAPARTGELRLNVKPADAAVYVDGVFRGNAEDVEDLDLPAGTHRIEVVRPGYVTYEREVTLRAGQNTDQRVELARTVRQ